MWGLSTNTLHHHTKIKKKKKNISEQLTIRMWMFGSLAFPRAKNPSVAAWKQTESTRQLQVGDWSVFLNPAGMWLTAVRLGLLTQLYLNSTKHLWKHFKSKTKTQQQHSIMCTSDLGKHGCSAAARAEIWKVILWQTLGGGIFHQIRKLGRRWYRSVYMGDGIYYKECCRKLE